MAMPDSREQTTRHHHHNRLRPFFQDHPSQPVPEESFFWTLWC